MGALLALLALLVVAGVLLLAAGGDDDPLDGLRALPAVADARRDGDGREIDVRLRPDADARAVLAVRDRLPADADGGRLRVGQALLEFDDRGQALDRLAPTLLALATIAVPGGPIELHEGYSSERITVAVDRRSQAAPLARRILARLVSEGVWRPGVGGLEVAVRGVGGRDEPPVTIGRLAGSARNATMVALSAAARLDDHVPRVVANGTNVELRLRADRPADADRVWRRAARALGHDRAIPDPDPAILYVDVPAADAAAADGRDGRRRWLPVVSGPAGDDPRRALALVRALGPDAGEPFANSDLGYAQADLRRAADAVRAATAAERAGARRLRLRWPRGADLDSDGDDDPAITVDDAPTVVRRLLPGLARARAAGLQRISWSGQPGAVPLLTLPQPAWLAPDTAPGDQPAALRRLARAVRRIGWPGVARFELIAGRGDCAGTPRAQATVRISSTSGGRARSAKPGAACTDAAAIAAVRRAWDATAAG